MIYLSVVDSGRVVFMPAVSAFLSNARRSQVPSQPLLFDGMGFPSSGGKMLAESKTELDQLAGSRSMVGPSVRSTVPVGDASQGLRQCRHARSKRHLMQILSFMAVKAIFETTYDFFCGMEGVIVAKKAMLQASSVFSFCQVTTTGSQNTPLRVRNQCDTGFRRPGCAQPKAGCAPVRRRRRPNFSPAGPIFFGVLTWHRKSRFS